MKEIVIFTIGPVQSFIAAARRTQDLWAGSRLLSDIMKTALSAASLDTLIFPQRTPDGDWPDSLPNRAVVVVESGQGAAVAEAMTKAARGRWEHIAEEVRKYFVRVVEPVGDWDWSEIWKRQVGNWLEVYWVACPWDDAAESYGAAYKRVSDLLDARKLTRHFPAHAEYDVKSTLDGAYQALRGVREGEGFAAKAFWDRAAKAAPRGAVRRGERLSAIDLVKRFAEDAEQLTFADKRARFPSTSSIACADYRLALMTCWSGKPDKPDENEKGTAEAVKAFVEALDALVKTFPTKREQERLRFDEGSHEPILKLQREAAGNDTLYQLGRYDGDYFYPDFYTEARFLDQLGRDPSAGLSDAEREAVKEARKALRTLYDCTDRLNIPRPAIYYAVIALDGDQIGKKLSHPDMTEKRHRAISGVMDRFAHEEVPRIAGDEYPALWVYAGGDDALVLSPVSCALAVADALRRAFEETVGAELKADADDPATASAGIAVVHQQNPLQEGIRRAKEAEEAAKRRPYGRDALVVHRLTRGGAPQRVGSNWDIGSNGEKQSIVEQVDALRGHIAEGRLSGKFAYELQSEADVLAMVARPGQTVEIGRLLKRHTPTEYRSEVLPMVDKLILLAEVWGQKGVERLADWAVLARFLATGGRRE